MSFLNVSAKMDQLVCGQKIENLFMVALVQLYLKIQIIHVLIWLIFWDVLIKKLNAQVISDNVNVKKVKDYASGPATSQWVAVHVKVKLLF